MNIIFLFFLFTSTTVNCILRSDFSRDDVFTRLQQRRPLVIIPGFASSRLRSFTNTPCPNNVLFQYNIGDDVWVDAKKIVGATSCFLHCILLDPVTQDDLENPLCRSRPDQGIDAITELDPGIVTGPLTVVWRDVVSAALKMGYEPDRNLVTSPYDFRLAPTLLEERDQYFSKLKTSIEHSVKYHEKLFKREHSAMGTRVAGETGIVVICHSMGTVVFLYFVKWLEWSMGELNAHEWLDAHIHTYIAVGAPLLGSIAALRGAVSGNTLGAPISEMDARLLTISFSSGPLMFPLDPSAHGIPKEKHERFQDPVDPIQLKYPNGTVKSYGVKDFDNKIWQDMSEHDSAVKYIASSIQRFYNEDPVLRKAGLQAWTRPPIRNVFCAYGVNQKTSVGYRFKKTNKVNDWDIEDTFYEENGRFFSEYNSFPNIKTNKKSGDGTVQYSSLSWCKTWLGETANITFVPQRKDYSKDEVKYLVNVDPADFDTVLSSNHEKVKFNSSIPYTTFYESSKIVSNQRIATSVWEFDGVDHLNILQSNLFLNELTHHLESLDARLGDMEAHLEQVVREMSHSFNIFTQHQAFAKPPTTDDECYWDYREMRCLWPTLCEYRYVFGDIHLSQSCRLRTSKSSTFSILESSPILQNWADILGLRKPSQQIDLYELQTESENINSKIGNDNNSYGNNNGDGDDIDDDIPINSCDNIPNDSCPRIRNDNVCECHEIDNCRNGFCKYKTHCLGATQPFGEENGWWGPCEKKDDLIKKEL